MDELAKHSSRLGIAEGDVEASINANGKEYVEIRFSCGVCMTKRDRVLVYVNKTMQVPHHRKRGETKSSGAGLECA